MYKYIKQHRCSSWLLPRSASPSKGSSRRGSATTTTQLPCPGTHLVEAGVVHRRLEGGRDQLRCLAGGRPPPRWKSSSRSTSEFLFNLNISFFLSQDLMYHSPGTMKMGHTPMATKGQTAHSSWRRGLQMAVFRANTATLM